MMAFKLREHGSVINESPVVVSHDAGGQFDRWTSKRVSFAADAKVTLATDAHLKCIRDGLGVTEVQDGCPIELSIKKQAQDRSRVTWCTAAGVVGLICQNDRVFADAFSLF